MHPLTKFVEQLKLEGLESLGRFYGFYDATVVSNVDPTGSGRVWLTIPSLGVSNVLAFPAPWLTPFGGSRISPDLINEGRIVRSDLGGFGFFFPPEPGEHVLIAYRFGVMEEPIVLGSLWMNPEDTFDDSRLPEEFKQVDATTGPTSRGIKTPVGHLLVFDDVSIGPKQKGLRVISDSGHRLELSDHFRNVILASAGSPAGDDVVQYGRFFIHDNDGYVPPVTPPDSPATLYLKPQIGALTEYGDRSMGLKCALTETRVEVRTGDDPQKFRKMILDDGDVFKLKEEGAGRFVNRVIATNVDESTTVSGLTIPGISAASPLEPGTLLMRVSSGSVDRQIYESGGRLLGFVDTNKPSSVGADGAVTVTFPAALDAGSSVYATYTAVGTVTREEDTKTDGVIRLQSPSGSRFEIWDEKSSGAEHYIEAVTEGSQKIRLEDKQPKITIETKGGFKITLDENGQMLSIETKNGLNITLDDSGPSISIETPGGQTIEMTDAGGSIDMNATMTMNIEAGIDITQKAMSLTGEATMLNEQKAMMMSINGNVLLDLKGGALTTIDGGAICEAKAALMKINSGTAPVVTGAPSGTMPFCYLTGLPIFGVPTVLAGP